MPDKKTTMDRPSTKPDVKKDGGFGATIGKVQPTPTSTTKSGGSDKKGAK